MFFENARRLNIKIYSQKEFANDRTDLVKQNQNYYESLGMELEEIKDMKKFQLDRKSVV